MTLEKGGGFFRTKGGELLPRGGGECYSPRPPERNPGNLYNIIKTYNIQTNNYRSLKCDQLIFFLKQKHSWVSCTQFQLLIQ